MGIRKAWKRRELTIQHIPLDHLGVLAGPNCWSATFAEIDR
jgi:hypothetical protein